MSLSAISPNLVINKPSIKMDIRYIHYQINYIVEITQIHVKDLKQNYRLNKYSY